MNEEYDKTAKAVGEDTIKMVEWACGTNAKMLSRGFFPVSWVFPLALFILWVLFVLVSFFVSGMR